MIYLTASPLQSSASSLLGLTIVLETIPEMSLSSPSAHRESKAWPQGRNFGTLGKGWPCSKEAPWWGCAPRGAGAGGDRALPLIWAQTTAQICSRRERGMRTKQHKPRHGPGVQTREFDLFIIHLLCLLSIQTAQGFTSRINKEPLPSCPHCAQFYSHLNANLLPACE